MAAYDFPNTPTLGQVYQEWTWDGEKWMRATSVSSAIVAIIDGGGSAITTGMKGYLEAPYACTLNQADLIADRTGSIVVNVWKCTYAQFDAGATHPVVGDKITSSTPPTLSSSVKSSDATLASWTTAIAAGDILGFNVDSVATVQRVTLTMKYTRSAGGGGGGVSYVTWDPTTVTAVTLSGGNLVATNTGTTSADQGAHVASTAGKSSGKYYFEVTFTALIGGGNMGAGIGTTASTYTSLGNNAITGVIMYPSAGGAIYANGSSSGIGLGGMSTGQTVEISVDLDNRKIWMRPHGGNWNNNVTYDPATNVGGIAIPTGTMVPFVTFGGSGGASGNVFTTNFGATAFTGTVPSGFTSGWPV